ncbi:MAG: glycogen debranching protein [Methanococcaceae archaeon]
MKIRIVFVFFVLCGMAFPQNQLYRSKSFSIYKDKVVQGKYTSLAKSSNEIISDYKSEFKKPTNRSVFLKFSINGLDNERAPGNDHQILLTQGGKTDTAEFVFAKPDLRKYNTPGPDENPLLESDKDLLVKVNMREVLQELKTKGYYNTFDGGKVSRDSFSGLYIAGGSLPLNWDFAALPRQPEFILQDADSDGIYEVTIHFKKQWAVDQSSGEAHWKLSHDISGFPQYNSDQVLTDALYNQALEEMLLDIRDDGAFMAGRQWNGIWTRDISYSITLALAIVNPDAAKTSLMAKVKEGKIIQDTGTGGAYPVSSDRMTWALAAWEIYMVTGDKHWLRNSYSIIKNSHLDDLLNVADKTTGIYRGESSFMDWREQSYPLWMDPKDIYASENLGTNAVHFQTCKILSEMAGILNEKSDQTRYLHEADKIKNGMNKYLWMDQNGYYGQYLYGREYYSLSPKSDALGEALSVLYDIAEKSNQPKIISSTPVLEFGVPCFYPEIKNIPPYHNNAIWPFVESFWALASAKVGNAKSVSAAIASIYRASSLFLTNKENMVASTGDYMGTEINSDRQLWSIAANLSIVYRILTGMEFHPDYLMFHPFIPLEYNGTRNLSNFKYRNSVLSITVSGYGNKIKDFFIDGKKISQPVVSAKLTGRHEIKIIMDNKESENQSINMKEIYFAPETPVVSLEGNLLKWKAISGIKNYEIYRNGKKILETLENSFSPKSENTLSEYQVLSVDKNNSQSFLSEPVVVSSGEDIIVQTEKKLKVANNYKNYSGEGYIKLSKTENQRVNISVDVPNAGLYSVDFRYANGNGPLNTDNKCAIRTLSVDKKHTGVVVLPQRGDGFWDNWGFTNSNKVWLSKGQHNIELYFDGRNENMNFIKNEAFLDFVRLRQLKEGK